MKRWHTWAATAVFAGLSIGAWGEATVTFERIRDSDKYPGD